MNKPVVAIVGRPNVGKSTLFNRIVGSRISIVEDEPSITRDRIYADAEWLGRPFLMVDTGGIEFNEEVKMKEKMRYQAEIAIEEADVILFTVDIRDGLTNRDKEIAELLRKADKPVIIAANKAENIKEAKLAKYDFYELGFSEICLVSAQHGQGTGDLLDEVISHFSELETTDYDEDVIKFSVVGRPNVGKSSLVNQMLGEERVIVSDIAGTTRDAIDTPFRSADQEYVIIDTAGMRRKGKVDYGVEKFSVIRALRAVDRSDVALIVIDAQEGVTNQDKRIAGYAHEEGKAVVLVVNKWDLIEKDNQTMDRYIEEIRYQVKFLNYAPITFVSALTGQRVLRILDLVDYVVKENEKRVKRNMLNDVINEAVEIVQPPSNKQGKRMKIYSAKQVGIKPPSFVLFVNDPELLNFAYERYLKNQLRKAFGFEGTPIRIKVRRK
ncbi:ribosome-associated GTPase EngA [Halobacteroides halobius DSM 5150]|uniref:GTPase Der n=1 Tax=Halobacteroides halobius (strain ATCC 35273 / DSM 5150 / MD-1) TaxID=748449 RepID=L0KAF8_HALHC|nr:ribosome biogenesis GTPase Der [Halobacteroides halobius]AGB41530.1 ribosome-associated GTPase EngA [Halobacteroides halobius DSM 5150]